MARHGKRFLDSKNKVQDKPSELRDAIDWVREIHPARYDETVEMAMALGVNPRHADQMVRGTVVLPGGLGKTRKVLVFASGEKQTEATKAGADYVGGEELAAKVASGWGDFDACVATPDMMRHVGKLGRVLGPRGLMPNPKTGTVTFDLKGAIEEIQAGKVTVKVDKTSMLHAPIGKVSFEAETLEENARAFIKAVVQKKPQVSKGRYIKSAYVCSTHGPGVKLDASGFEKMG